MRKFVFFCRKLIDLTSMYCLFVLCLDLKSKGSSSLLSRVLGNAIYVCLFFLLLPVRKVIAELRWSSTRSCASEERYSGYMCTFFHLLHTANINPIFAFPCPKFASQTYVLVFCTLLKCRFYLFFAQDPKTFLCGYFSFLLKVTLANAMDHLFTPQINNKTSHG